MTATATRLKQLCTELPPVAAGCNDTGRDFWVFENAWGDDYADKGILHIMRALFEADGLPYTIQHFPAAPLDEQPEDTWASHPSLTAEQRN